MKWDKCGINGDSHRFSQEKIGGCPHLSITFELEMELVDPGAGLRWAVEAKEGKTFRCVGGQEHAAGFDTHQLCRLEIGHDDDGLPDDLFGAVILPHTGDDLPFPIDFDRQLQKLFRLGNALCGEDRCRTEIHLIEILV